MEVKIDENLCEKTILENITNPSIYFVFNTSISAEKWMERILEDSTIQAVAVERFLVWDDFKAHSIRSIQQNKTSINSILRKLFTESLLQKNAEHVEKNEQPLFLEMVNPTYAKEGINFADWICSILPSLNLWNKKQTNIKDNMDKDLSFLFSEYSKFLNENNLFEPAWELPPFVEDGNHYFIFYPEIFSDYSEYKSILLSNKNITLISCETLKKEKPNVTVYENSRQELRETAILINKLTREKNIPYTKIAISVPDLEIYEPYLTRELDLYQIPYVSRAAKKYSAYGTSALFQQIQNCYNSSFSFASCKELLFNNELPWKEKECIKNLIQHGIDKCCICSYTDNNKTVDLWEESFKITTGTERENNFYKALKKSITNIVSSKKFEDIRKHYFDFRNTFFNQELFTEENNLILGECLIKLSELIDIEDRYPNLKSISPFSFFVSLLESEPYLKQATNQGVMIYSYKNVATAVFDVHIVLNCSQSNISITYSPLKFLRQDKRDALQLKDENPSDFFIQLYNTNSIYKTFYSCAKKTFSGYELPHSSLQIADKKNDKTTFDFFRDETSFLLSDFSEQDLGNTKPLFSIIQKNSFNAWNNSQRVFSIDTKESLSLLQDKILKSSLYKEDKIRVSNTAMKDFFYCPRLWIFNRILNLQETTTQVELESDMKTGIIYHKILETFLTQIKKKTHTICNFYNDDKSELSNEYKKLLRESISVVLSSQISETSPLTYQLLRTQEEAINNLMENCVYSFLQKFENYTIIACEKKYYLDNEEWFIDGTLDCILVSPDDDVAIVDFKTKHTPKKDESILDTDGNLVDFQLTLYIMLYEANNDVEVSEAFYFSIVDAVSVPIISTNITEELKKDYEKEPERKLFEPTIKHVKQMIETYVNAIKSLDLSEAPTPTILNCLECNNNNICRNTYTIAGNNIYSKVGNTNEQ